MPELPEVETIVADLRPRLEGQKITGVTTLWPGAIALPSEEEFMRELVGQRIEKVWRRGKNVVIDLSGGNKLVVHLRMTGRLLWRDALAPEDKHTRVLIHLNGAKELRFADARKFGRMALLNPEQFQRLNVSLGPEPLGKEFTLERFKEVIDERGTRIKSLLLDQRYMVGLGNIYADEALFEARIHPLRPAATLTGDEIERLFRAVKHVLSAGVADRGTSFDSYLDAFGRPGSHQLHLSVYRRTGGSCPRCGTSIQRIVVGGRGTHFCPSCQPITPSQVSETAPPLRTAPRRRS